MAEKLDKTSIDDNAFEALEKEFQDVILELMGDKSLEKFKIEYEKLHRALKKSHESEKRLMGKCRELNSEIVANSAKVTTALKLSQEDQSTIASLKKEIEKAWKMVDAAHEKETRARETITQLKLEISNLSKLVEQGAGLSMGQENSVNELIRAREEITRERDDLLAEVVRLREMNADGAASLQTLEAEKADVTSKMNELQQDIVMKDNEAQRELRKKDKLEREIKQTKAEIEIKTDECKNLSNQIDKYKHDIDKSEGQVKGQKIELERAAKELEILQTRLLKCQDDHDKQASLAKDLAEQNQNRVGELKRREEDIQALKAEISKINKVKEQTMKKLKTCEEQRDEFESDREHLKTQISSMEKEIASVKEQHERDKKAIEGLDREKNVLNKSVLKAQADTSKQKDLAKVHQHSKKTLEQEIANYKEENQKQRKIIYQLEKERDRYINEASDLTQKVLKHMEDVKVREMQIFDLKKKIAEAETKYRQQQNLYEAVRSDRNLYSKNLIESQDEITEYKRKIKIMTHQIEQLKEEIASKDTQLVKEHSERQRVIKEKEALRTELKRIQQQQSEAKAHIESQANEERKLLKTISEADAERIRQKKELDQVIAERDILGTQLVRRNDELALLYEKIKIQQSTLNKGELQYNQRLEDIRVLKLEIRKMRREKGLLQKSVRDIDELKREVYRLQRQLLQERTRCRALEEELENPLNIHRWRRLEGSDPSRFEMIQKIQALQKRLINKTEEVVEKELLLQEKEKIYVELKHILARQPGPEVSEQLQIYKQTLKDKTKQMKSMSSELNMYESQIEESRFEIDRLSRELQEVKKKFYLQKKKEIAQKDKEAILNGKLGPIMPQRTDGAKFAGGGFNLKSKPTVMT